MPSYEQADRMLTMTTPLGPDKLLLVGFLGTEAISQLFEFQLAAIATHDTKIPFDQLLGKKVTAHIRAPGGQKRHFSGICNRVAQGGRDATFTHYRLTIVPEFWFLTRKTQSRIFQQKSVKDILQKVLQGLAVQFQLTGTYEPRDYCVQYRESDFDFASRTMEEEGIFYFFKHDQSSSTMVVADAPSAHLDVPFDSQATYAPQTTDVAEDRILIWEKTQDLRSMKVTLWDHCFELPHKHLEAEKEIQDSVQVGQESHKLKVGSPDRLELYDWPGGYAQRFDGVDPGRGDRPADIQKIFQDNKRTTDLRIQEEAAGSLMISGESRLRQLTAGHKFQLKEHFNADGQYLLTTVTHRAGMSSDYRSGAADEDVAYENSFTCIPAALPFRPQRVTPRPVVHGTQTAVVVGPKGEEIYTDKYGRVKVQFHWDREGKNDEKSSCWVRVAQLMAGRRWGTSFWPRIGQEVVVDYLEGDPDQPIIVGSVYNADQMPAYLGKGPDSKHADSNMVAGFKSNSTKGGAGYNEWRFDDTKDKQQIFVRAERNMDTRVKKDSMELVEGDRHLIVGDQGGNQYEQIAKDKHLHVKGNQVEKIDKTMVLSIGSTLDQTVGGQTTESFGAHDMTVKGDRKTKVGNSESLTVGQNYQEKVGMKRAVEAGQEIHLKAGMKVILEAGMQLTLKGPGGFVDIGPTGVTIQGIMVLINSGGAAGAGSGSSPDSPKDPKAAEPKDPTKADDSATGQKSC